MTKLEVIKAINAELDRQSQLVCMNSIYTYNGDAMGYFVDGYLNVVELADAILKVIQP